MRRLHHIVRLDRPVPLWRVQIRRSGRVCTKTFTDPGYGGRKAALAKAFAYRDRLLRILPVRSAIKTVVSRSKTGVIGVYVKKYRRASGGEARFYVANWRHAGRQHRRVFSVERDGEAKARALAVAARRSAIREVLRWRGVPPLKPKRGNAGVVGVHFVEKMTPAGTLVRYYDATWTDRSGREHRRTFSIRMLGRRRALALAIQARRAALRRR